MLAIALLCALVALAYPSTAHAHGHVASLLVLLLGVGVGAPSALIGLVFLVISTVRIARGSASAAKSSYPVVAAVVSGTLLVLCGGSFALALLVLARKGTLADWDVVWFFLPGLVLSAISLLLGIVLMQRAKR